MINGPITQHAHADSLEWKHFRSEVKAEHRLPPFQHPIFPLIHGKAPCLSLPTRGSPCPATLYPVFSMVAELSATQSAWNWLMTYSLKNYGVRKGNKGRQRPHPAVTAIMSNYGNGGGNLYTKEQKISLYLVVWLWPIFCTVASWFFFQRALANYIHTTRRSFILLCCVQLLVTPWISACQPPPPKFN